MKLNSMFLSAAIFQICHWFLAGLGLCLAYALCKRVLKF